MMILKDIKKGVIDMKVEETAELTKKALDEGFKPEHILKEALIPAINIVGDEYERGERFVPEMFLSADSMKGAMEILRPLLVESGIEPAGKVVMGTVKGDLHDIGQNLVCIMLEGAGFEVHNLGVEVPAEHFVEAVEEVGAHLVGMSALLTTTMIHMRKVIEALKRAGLREQVKVMVGGAPVTHDYADKIGADGYAPDASAAVKLAKELMAQLKGESRQKEGKMYQASASTLEYNLRSQIEVQDEKNLLGGLRRPAHYLKSTMRACIIG